MLTSGQYAWELFVFLCISFVFCRCNNSPLCEGKMIPTTDPPFKFPWTVPRKTKISSHAHSIEIGVAHLYPKRCMLRLRIQHSLPDRLRTIYVLLTSNLQHFFSYKKFTHCNPVNIYNTSCNANCCNIMPTNL